MKNKLVLVLFAMLIVFAWGCSSSSDDDVQDVAGQGTPAGGDGSNPGGGPGDNPGDTPEQKPAPAEFFATQGLKLIKAVEINGDKGWLCEYPGKFTDGTGLDGKVRPPVSKKCMVLSGKPYSLGWQSAMLMPGQGNEMCTKFVRRVALDQLWTFGIHLPQEGEQSDKLYKLIYDSAVLMGEASLTDIPAEYVDEMKGFVDGMHAAGYPDITFNDLLVMNQAVDATYYLIGAALGYCPSSDKNRELVKQLRLNLVKMLVLSGQKETDPKLFLEKNGFRMPTWGCNELAVTGSATTGGGTYHGRDFMFATADIYQDCSVMAVYLTDRGHPFATITVPGFVGQSTAMNSEGLSAGQDICMVGVAGITPGVGSMLVIRDIVQNSANLDEAVRRMRAIPRGVPWIYFIADDDRDARWGNAAELETITNQYPVAGPEKINILEKVLFLKYINKLDEDQLVDGYIDGGVMVRGMTWEYPEAFIGEGNDALNPDNRAEYNEHYSKGINFPMQHEINPDVIAAANHFIIPRLAMLHYDPVVYLGYTMSGQMPESIWRYEMMERDLEKYKGSIDFFGEGDVPAEGSAGWLIDFLNTQRENQKFYGKAPDRTVEGHHAVIDNDNRIIMGLYGYMDDPWMKVELMNFVKWHYQN